MKEADEKGEELFEGTIFEWGLDSKDTLYFIKDEVTNEKTSPKKAEDITIGDFFSLCDTSYSNTRILRFNPDLEVYEGSIRGAKWERALDRHLDSWEMDKGTVVVFFNGYTK